MRKVIALGLAIVMCLGLCGCATEEDLELAYDEGYEKGYDEGYDAAYNKIKDEIAGITENLEAIQAGVYYSNDYVENPPLNNNDIEALKFNLMVIDDLAMQAWSGLFRITWQLR